jgi:hypothetical protein
MAMLGEQMRNPRSHPERDRTPRLRPRTLVRLSLALTLLLTGCGGGRSAGEGSDAGGVGGGPPQTTGDPGVSPPRGESSLDRYEALARRELRRGSIVYNPPEEMRLDERTRIEARVTRQPDSTFTSDLQGKGAPRVEQLPVGTKMRGQLLSGDFTITPLRPEVQQLGATGVRSWVWEIQPSRSGQRTLTLVLSVVYEGDVLEYRSFDRSIDVRVTPAYATGSWLSRNWDRLLGALGVTAAGAVGGILAILRRRRTRGRGAPGATPARPLEGQRSSR